MADPQNNPPDKPTPEKRIARTGVSPPDSDEAIDAALAAATGGKADDPRGRDVPLRRQWDSEMEAELEAALSGFDPKTFDVASSRPPRAERAPGPSQQRGQEGQPGLRT